MVDGGMGSELLDWEVGGFGDHQDLERGSVSYFVATMMN
jgi:hypothetical protein